jgi:hypothetical protein
MVDTVDLARDVDGTWMRNKRGSGVNPVAFRA